ncbi:MAG: hypothetical protein ACRDUV_21995 [Pseudonocardiaceae bacterium]
MNEEDLAISGGTGALDWLIDRLERTQLDEWREASLLWPLGGLLDRRSTPATLCSTTTHEWARDALLQLSTTLDAPESHGVSSAIE